MEWVNFGLATFASLLAIYAAITASYNRKHVNQWLVDIPAFYKDFPLQLKQDIRSEMKPTLDLILEDLQALKKREFWSAHAQAIAAAPDGISRLGKSVAELVGRGDFSAALDTLATMARTRQEQHEVVLLRYRYSSIQQEEREGTKSHDTIAREKREIATSILASADDFGSGR